MNENNDHGNVEDQANEARQNECEHETYRAEVNSGLPDDISKIDENIPTKRPSRKVSDNESEKQSSFKMYKSVQNFSLASSICGAISVIIGGVLLGGIGLALGIVAFSKSKKLNDSDFDAQLMKKVKRSVIVAIVICVGSILLNFVSAMMLFPTIMSYLQTEDISSISSVLDASSPSPSSRTSTWG